MKLRKKQLADIKNDWLFKIGQIVTDQENEQELAYLDENSLVTPPNFTSTLKRGYVEDEVDHWVQKTAANTEGLVNQYNLVVYRCLTAEHAAVEAVQKANELTEQNEELKNQVLELQTKAQEADELTQQVAQLQAQLAEALSNPVPVDSPVETETVDPYAYAPVEEEVEELSYETPVEETVGEETYNGSDEISPVEEAPTIKVSDTVIASERAQRILDAAAKEASNHVSRSLERVAEIEAEAETAAAELVSSATRKAEELVADATEEATSLVEAAAIEAEAIKVNAREESADVIARTIAAREHGMAVFSKIAAFHEYELTKSQEIFNYLSEIDAPSETSNVETAVEPVEEKTFVEVDSVEEQPSETSEEDELAYLSQALRDSDPNNMVIGAVSDSPVHENLELGEEPLELAEETTTEKDVSESDEDPDTTYNY